MHMLNPPYTLWSVWKELYYLEQMFILVLAAVTLYCVFSTVRTVLRARSVWNRLEEDVAVRRERVAVLASRYANVRQVVGAAFYLFGVVLFLGLENITNVADSSRESVAVYALSNFIVNCAFAANVFVIFLLLHLIQWSGSAILNSISRRLNPA
jgi:hypothetical protein